MTTHAHFDLDPEARRLAEDAHRIHNWKRWGPYLSERQWATVREDYSADGSVWTYFPHDHARSRAYRWGEDGLLGICDRECRLCFSLALWNGRDPILKERLFGLTGPEGNHGEDVKECYFYLDATPTHSYLKALYKYPQREFPYQALVEQNQKRTRDETEYELTDTGVFDDDRYFDVFAEYAKVSPDDMLVRITLCNRGPEDVDLHVLPTLWFRNTWSWGCEHEGCDPKPRLSRAGHGTILAEHSTLGQYHWHLGAGPDGAQPTMLFTENETNVERLYGSPNPRRYVKDAFHRYVIEKQTDAVNPQLVGTKAAALYRLHIPAHGQVELRLRLAPAGATIHEPLAGGFTELFDKRVREADRFYATHVPQDPDDTAIGRQAYAGLLWSKQFYHMVVRDWLDGDPAMPPPPASRKGKDGRNRDWGHLFSRDVLSMPDKWEYPWFAAWDLAFHMIPMSRIDPEFAKHQLLLLLREWYMHPNGQIPAYEFSFCDVNPPVHAWACWRVYKMTGPRGKRDVLFLARAFQKLMLNFTWWVNRKDIDNQHVFSGGFLGLDNIGVFDRSKALPGGFRLEQADGTAWMGFYCATMLAMALELAQHDPSYEDIASKFFEHFVAIADAMNTLGGCGLWDPQDGFYFDRLTFGSHNVPMRVRSMVGLVPLFTVEVLEEEVIGKLPGFRKRMNWFLKNRRDLARHIAYMQTLEGSDETRRLLAIPSRERLLKVLSHVFDEREFLSPFGVRSLSKLHAEQPFELPLDGQIYRVGYEPGESRTGIFGGNSNWRGPVWFPVNFLLIEALERYHYFYGDALRIEYPTGSGRLMNLQEISRDLAQRLVGLFRPDEQGHRPMNGREARFARDPHWKNLVLFHEYFDGDTGRGLGASHQTGWTSLVTRCIENLGRNCTLGAPLHGDAMQPTPVNEARG